MQVPGVDCFRRVDLSNLRYVLLDKVWITVDLLQFPQHEPVAHP